MHLLLILSLLGWQPTPALAEQIGSTTVEFSSSTAPFILQAIAAKYDIDPEPFIATAKCESRFNALAVGDRGTSFGVFQIHLSAHPDVSKAEALDPWFAIEWAAQQFKAGRERMWTCWRLHQAGALSP